MTEDEWTNDRGELVDVGRMLNDAGCFPTPEDVLNYFEKPWKWSNERELWVAADRPSPSDRGWELFAARLDALEVRHDDH